MRERLKALIAQMRWSGMAAVLDEELDLAERQGTPVPEVLFRLLGAEDAARREKSLAYRLSQAHLPWPWTLQSFPFARQPSVNKAQVMTLAGLEFLRRGENVLLIGPPGTGKSGIAVGLLREACLNGYRARFYNAQALLDALYASLADRSTVGLLNQLCRFPLIAIDELGYLNLKPEQVNAFFRLMDQRYSLGLSTLITTNKLCGAPHNLFNAELKIMQSPLVRGSDLMLFLGLLTAHKGAGLEQGHQVIGRLEAPGA
jgi:DNA replication protein DnaC